MNGFSTTEAVTVQRLVKQFGDFTAVNDISFSVKRGEIFGFLGPNGAGKSTTIRMLCGIITPTSGDGTVDGLDIMTDSEKIKEKIGYMSQKFSLYEDLTVEENIEFYADIYDVPVSKIQERKQWIYRMANLQDRAKSLTAELAMGLKQRLALGCAIIHEPKILFLDEPTAGVDPVSRRNFWDLIYTVADQGVTVFVTTHYMDEAEHCDRLAMIYRGKLIALGTPKELKGSKVAGTLYEARGDHPMRIMDAVRDVPRVREVAIFGTTVHFMCDGSDHLPQVLAAFARQGLGHLTVEPIPPSLEDVFVALVEQADQALEQGT